MNTPYSFPVIHLFHPDRQRRDKWQALKILEEASELVETAKQSLKADTGDTAQWQDMIAYDICDLLQTIANFCDAYQISETQLATMMRHIDHVSEERGMFHPGERTRMHR